MELSTQTVGVGVGGLEGGLEGEVGAAVSDKERQITTPSRPERADDVKVGANDWMRPGT